MENITVVFCFNDRYCTLAAGAIASLIKNTTLKYSYDIYIIHNDISDLNIFRLNKINNKQNVKIIFRRVNLKSYFTGDFFIWRDNFSKDTYTRLFLHKILPSIDKVLYLDGDLIITSDIADLYNVDISHYSLAAAQDIDAMQGPEILLSRKISNNLPEEIRKYENRWNYYTQYLGFSQKEIENYFNAGVILINLQRARKILDRAYELLENIYLGQDQCILNILFKNDKLILDNRYNVGCGEVDKFVNDHGKLPDIIHYWAHSKPSNSMSSKWASEYWRAIRDTDFYYPALDSLVNNKLGAVKSNIKDQINQVKDSLSNPCTLEDLYYNLRRTHKVQRRRRYLRVIIKLLVDSKKYKKLKRDPGRFFGDSKSAFIRLLGRYYI